MVNGIYLPLCCPSVRRLTDLQIVCRNLTFWIGAEKGWSVHRRSLLGSSHGSKFIRKYFIEISNRLRVSPEWKQRHSCKPRLANVHTQIKSSLISLSKNLCDWDSDDTHWTLCWAVNVWTGQIQRCVSEAPISDWKHEESENKYLMFLRVKWLGLKVRERVTCYLIWGILKV